MHDKTKLRMSERIAGSKPPPRRLKRKASSQTVGSGKKKKLAESSSKATAVSETAPESESLQEGSKVCQRKTLNKAEKLNMMD